MTNKDKIFQLKPVHPDFVDNVLRTLKNSKSAGKDDIDTYILKVSRPFILPALTRIINLSITTNKFPDKWKISKIIPLHKKDDKTLAKNFRPVALVPVASKVLERAVHVQLVHHLEEENLLHPSHHGYRSHHSTTTALLEMYDSWVEAQERGELAGVCLVDLSSAFDCVDHFLLKEKMKVMLFSEDVIQWFSSYLDNRTQYVTIDASDSECLDVEAGVPQGSILGPLLYLLFTCDLPDYSQGRLRVQEEGRRQVQHHVR